MNFLLRKILKNSKTIILKLNLSEMMKNKDGILYIKTFEKKGEKMKRTIERKNTSKEFEKFVDDTKVKCKCSHSMFIRPTVKKIICKHCGCWVYKNKIDEFKDKMQIQLKGDEMRCL